MKTHTTERATLIVALVIVGMMLSCCHGGTRGQDAHSKQLAMGDLLLVASAPIHDSTTMSSAIVAATGHGGTESFVHVAIVEVVADEVWVIDATPEHGVARRPLATFLNDFTDANGTPPTVVVKRLTDTTNVAHYVAQAKTFCGRAYDSLFLPYNQEQYCSELVRNAYVTAHGDTLFHQQPMNFAAPDGTMPTYWQRLFDAAGLPIPQGLPGTNPQDLSLEPCLRSVGRLENLTQQHHETPYQRRPADSSPRQL